MTSQQDIDKVLSTLFAIQTYLEAERTNRIANLGGPTSIKISPLAAEVDNAINILLGREGKVDGE